MALQAREGDENRAFHVSAAFVGDFPRKSRNQPVEKRETESTKRMTDESWLVR
jgi:hypothetical protein